MMNASWIIERLVPDRDLGGLLEVAESSFTSPWTREMFAAEIRRSEVSHIYVARIGQVVVAGFCSCWLIFEEFHINNLAVRPEWRGRGLGTALLEHALTEGRRLGATKATLEVRRSNEAARRLYRRLGFEVSGTRPNYYTNPVEDALILWHRDLTAAGSTETKGTA